ncbi:unnamed protein product, partial [marine sediment metagenome]
ENPSHVNRSKTKQGNAMAAGDVYQVTAENEIAGMATQTVFHYREISPSNSTVPELDILEGWTAQVSASWIGLLSNRCAFDQLTCKRISPEPRAEVRATVVSGIGQIDGENLPANSAAVLSMRSQFASRRRRGRNYISGLPEISQFSGTLTTTFIDIELTALATALLEPIIPVSENTGSWALTVWSPTAKLAAPASPPWDTLVERIEIDSILRNQRPRTSNKEHVFIEAVEVDAAHLHLRDQTRARIATGTTPHKMVLAFLGHRLERS